MKLEHKKGVTKSIQICKLADQVQILKEICNVGAKIYQRIQALHKDENKNGAIWYKLFRHEHNWHSITTEKLQKEKKAAYASQLQF